MGRLICGDGFPCATWPAPRTRADSAILAGTVDMPRRPYYRRDTRIRQEVLMAGPGPFPLRALALIPGAIGALALGFWCIGLGILSFLPIPAGPGLPRAAGGAGLQFLAAAAGLITVTIVFASSVALARSPSLRAPLWLIAAAAAWALAAASAASAADGLFLAPENQEAGIGAGVASVAAPAWSTFLWTTAAVCAALAALLLVHRMLGRHEARTAPAGVTTGGA